MSRGSILQFCITVVSFHFAQEGSDFDACFWQGFLLEKAVWTLSSVPVFRQLSTYYDVAQKDFRRDAIASVDCWNSSTDTHD